MKKYLKEIVIILIQLFMFYVSPLFAGPADGMGMVLLILLVTFLLSIAMAFISKKKIIYFYPIVVAILFIPSIFIYYNETALIHSIWYLVDSYIGILFGVIINRIVSKNDNKGAHK